MGFVGVVLGLAWPASPPAARGHTPRWPGGQGTGRNPWVDSPPVFLGFLGFLGAFLCLAWPASLQPHVVTRRIGQGGRAQEGIPACRWSSFFSLVFLGFSFVFAWPASLQPHVVVRRNGLGGRAQEGIPGCGWVPLGLLGFLGAWSGLGRRNGQGTR